VKGPPAIPTQEDSSALDSAFALAMEPWTRIESPFTLLFSGGVDSGLLAWELRRRAGLSLITIGIRGSPDLRAAEESAALIGTRWMAHEITPSEVREAMRRIQGETAGLPRTSRSVLLALELALVNAPGTTVLCGQGADELFLGYAHFRGLAPGEAAARSETDLRLLLERDWPRSQRLAQRSGRNLSAPYLHPAFVATARAIPIERRLPHPVPKGLFRRWAMRRGLPPEIASRPKRALQYGSGVDRLVPHDARREPDSR
jgi:asparagine synthase (glutamine-hydrolysing)